MSEGRVRRDDHMIGLKIPLIVLLWRKISVLSTPIRYSQRLRSRRLCLTPARAPCGETSITSVGPVLEDSEETELKQRMRATTTSWNAADAALHGRAPRGATLCSSMALCAAATGLCS